MIGGAYATRQRQTKALELIIVVFLCGLFLHVSIVLKVLVNVLSFLQSVRNYE